MFDESCTNGDTCCVAFNETECGSRKYYSSCINRDNIPQTFSFPNESSEFINEEGVFDWSIVFEEVIIHIYPLVVLVIQISSTYLAYWLCYFVCQSKLQRECFAFPISLSQILILIPLLIMCSKFNTDPCIYSGTFPSGFFFNCNDGSFTSFIQTNWIFILAFLSQAWVTMRIWIPKSQRLAQVQDIFVGSFYESLLIEQSLMFRLDQNKDEVNKKKEEMKREGEFPRIIGCATMWHETKEEMELLLQSALDMNELNGDTFTWKLRIFFDDAFKDGHVNEYVDRLFEAMDSVHAQRNKEKPIPILEDTPFGGNITWELKGNTHSREGSKVVCHLKDKSKIRIKKRWSQCMYFEYFRQKSGGNRFSIRQGFQKIAGRKNGEGQYNSENTFILALDGDVDFKPDAVSKLLDVMIKNKDIGAACGRIHPTGKGIIPIYQQFEYAVGHWLQKSTEDALGNVLCSPGCFSLFRLKSVIENNLKTRKEDGYKEDPDTYNRKQIKKREKKIDLHKTSLEKYFTKSTEAKHCIQYDQGEDRWLCTLLIARGWEVEYVASSHSYTACPDNFDEFYNQRRRWSPSTVANLLDLLSKWRILLRHGNGNIVHMLYQVLTISASAIGPGGIFLMLVGGCHMAFGMGYWWSLGLNSAFLAIFLLVSLFREKKLQLLVAKALSIIFAIVMLVVMALLIIEAIRLRDTCKISPSTFSLILVVSAFLLAGLLHPKEFFKLRCLVLHGIVYYLTIPSMYMLLPFYCVFNLNDVSWGTREDIVVTKEIEKKEMKEVEKSKDLFAAKVLQVVAEEKKKKEQIKCSDWKDNVLKVRKEAKSRELIAEEQQIWEKVKMELLPIEQSEKEKAEIKTGLNTLRTETFLFFLFVNVAFIFVVFLLQVRFQNMNRFSLNWPLCKISVPIIPEPKPLNMTTTPTATTAAIPYFFSDNYDSYTEEHYITSDDVKYFTLDPINLVFMAFFLGVMLFQVCGMIFHRIRTVGHLLYRTPWGKTEKMQRMPPRRRNSGYTFDVYKSNEPGTTFDSYPSVVEPGSIVSNNPQQSDTSNSYVNIQEINTESNMNESADFSSEEETDYQAVTEDQGPPHYMKSENIHHVYTSPTVIHYTTENIAHL